MKDVIIIMIIAAMLLFWGFFLGWDVGRSFSIPNRVDGYCIVKGLSPARTGKARKWICIDTTQFVEVNP